ncbi:MAG: hypothetical protein J0I41_06480 [Filimonas sp.]|nr:hypothetical protein [Filimonas sp.]
MQTPNRDLLVLAKNNQRQLEQEVELLNKLLYHVENENAFCIANEVIDVNRCRIIKKQHQIIRTIRAGALKPFVFINNKN